MGVNEEATNELDGTSSELGRFPLLHLSPFPAGYCSAKMFMLTFSKATDALDLCCSDPCPWDLSGRQKTRLVMLQFAGNAM